MEYDIACTVPYILPLTWPFLNLSHIMLIHITCFENDRAHCNALSLKFQKERKSLEVKRLDLDASKGKLRRAKAMEAQRNVSISKYLNLCHSNVKLKISSILK